ncbi:MAG: peptide chain release factor 2 [Alphaproteobacteria bacterium]|nr:peptide chain release factor 2 [Alphaproteobacteria bacterium]
MQPELEEMVSTIRQSVSLLRRRLDWGVAEKRLDELNALSEDPAFWNDPAKAQTLMRERNRLASAMDDVRELERETQDAVDLWDLADAEGDSGMFAEVEASLRSAMEKAEAAELKALLSGEVDGNDCYLEIHAGEGGTESQDWASMLRRMYVRWAGKRGFKVEEIEESPGETAGIKSATLAIHGDSAYGWLKSESGVHRLVRISPFDANARRHTSFAAVSVYPVIDDTIEVEINEKDVRVDTYRASGAGGQHINKTDSAVRLTHIPTGIVVSSQQDRSQHKNRAIVWEMLRARLYELELKKREDAAQAEQDAKSRIGFGRQIRSYVLQPYQMVKDLRTGVETSDSQGVLDGDIDRFLSAALSQKVGSGTEVEDLD